MHVDILCVFACASAHCLPRHVPCKRMGPLPALPPDVHEHSRHHLTCMRTAGIIPGSFSDQRGPQRLAMCNDIGEAAYVDSLVASALLDAVAGLPTGAAIRRRLATRYGVPWAPGQSSAPPLLDLRFRP